MHTIVTTSNIYRALLPSGILGSDITTEEICYCLSYSSSAWGVQNASPLQTKDLNWKPFPEEAKCRSERDWLSQMLPQKIGEHQLTQSPLVGKQNRGPLFRLTVQLMIHFRYIILPFFSIPYNKNCTGECQFSKLQGVLILQWTENHVENGKDCPRYSFLW